MDDIYLLAQEQKLSISLPKQSDLASLSDLVSRYANASLQYDPQKLRGTVNLNISGNIDRQRLWDIYNQVLNTNELCSVVTQLPPVYLITPTDNALNLSMMINSSALGSLPLEPSFLVIQHELSFLNSDETVKMLTTLIGGKKIAQVRSLGKDNKRILIAGMSSAVHNTLAAVKSLDHEGLKASIKSFEPENATAQQLLAALNSAWTSLQRIQPTKRDVSFILAPDQRKILIIGQNDAIAEILAVAKDLDAAESVSSTSYRPKHFPIDDVADLLEEILATDQGENNAKIIRDSLTGTLIIEGTPKQHERVKEFIERLDNIPTESQKAMRRFVIKNRDAEDLLAVVQEILSTENEERRRDTQNNNNTDTNTNENQADNTDNQNDIANVLSAANENSESDRPATRINVDLSIDPHTNSLIAIGTPLHLDTLHELIEDLDQRHSQVELEIYMVSLNDDDQRALGIELVHSFESGGTTVNLASLFGLSEVPEGSDSQSTDDRRISNANGFVGTILNPGNFASFIRALETVSDAKNIISSTAVVTNNSQTTIDSVRQEPLTNFNAGDRFSTTTFSGTTDAGTKILLTPRISAADYITLEYDVSNSSFLGESTTTADGVSIPPPKREDKLVSVSNIPDGHIIILGGLSTKEESQAETRVPFLGSIPLLGLLFRSKTTTLSMSKSFVFVRASILRDEDFASLRHRSQLRLREAEAKDEEWPTLEPILMK